MEMLWVCLAVMAVHFKQLGAAHVAYAALVDTNKILHIDSIQVAHSFISFHCKITQDFDENVDNRFRK